LSVVVLGGLLVTALPRFGSSHPAYDVVATMTAFTVVGLVWAAYFQRATLTYQRQHDEATLVARRRALAEAMQVELHQTPEVFEVRTVRCLATVVHRLAQVNAKVDLYARYLAPVDQRWGPGGRTVTVHRDPLKATEDAIRHLRESTDHAIGELQEALIKESLIPARSGLRERG